MPVKATVDTKKVTPRRRVWIAIDPGVSGGIAVIQEPPRKSVDDLAVLDDVIQTFNMPRTETDLWELIRSFTLPEMKPFAVIEKVGGFISGSVMGTDGVAGGKKNIAAGHGMFKFGLNYGSCRMALIGNRIPFDEVLPFTWQQELGIPPRKKSRAKRGKYGIKVKLVGETTHQWKSRLKQKAQQLFPSVTITLHTSDALLMVEYARMTYASKARQSATTTETETAIKTTTDTTSDPLS